MDFLQFAPNEGQFAPILSAFMLLIIKSQYPSERRKQMVNKFLADKRYGFFVSIVGILMSVVAAIVYAVMYHAYVNFMSWTSFAMFLVGSVLALILLVLKMNELASVAAFSGSLLGALFFIRYIYPYVSVVLFGVDISSFSSNFIVSTIFISIAFVITLVAMFLPKVKENN